MRDRSQGLLDLKGLVTDVSGPQRNACPGTLIPQEAWLPCWARSAGHALAAVIAVGVAGRKRECYETHLAEDACCRKCRVAG